jgi:signal peptidase I
MRLLCVTGDCLARSLRWLFWGLVALAAVTLVLALAPGLLNRQLLAVTGGSMEPAFAAGDALLTHPIDDASHQVAAGDIVVLRAGDGSALLAHRVLLVATDASGRSFFKTGGDANAETDPGWATERQVKARVLMTLPGLGALLHSLSQPLVRLALFVLPLVYLGIRELAAGLSGFEEVEAW